jgi:hypothetical protein
MKKMPVALAVAMSATVLAWAPRGWAQEAGSTNLPPQLQTDAQRKAARAAPAPAEAAPRLPAGGGNDTVAAALGAAMLADVMDAAAASAHDAATGSPRGPDPVAEWRGGVDPDAGAGPADEARQPPGYGPR